MNHVLEVRHCVLSSVLLSIPAVPGKYQDLNKRHRIQTTGARFDALFFLKIYFMDTTAFNIQFRNNDRLQTAEVRPCCQENNIVDYAIWIDNKLAFTVTKSHEDDRWVISLKNADDTIEDEEVQSIGAAISQRAKP